MLDDPVPRPADSTVALREASAEPLKLGAPGPDFSLDKLDGKPAQLADFQHKPLVLIFGSMTCPTFREQAAALNDLKKQQSRRANFLVIYTREAHALGEWEVERNRDDDLRIEQPATIEARVRLAKSAQAGLKLTMDLVVDTLDDKVTLAYRAFPNGAVILDGDRNVAAAFRWAEPHALTRAIEAAEKKSH